MGAAAAVLVVLLMVRPWRPRELGGLGVVTLGDGVRTATAADGRVSVEGGPATLADRGQALTLELSASTTVQRSAGGLRVWRGRVRVSAQHRAQGSAPATVLVSGGAIDVMGTHFTVEQREERGEVSLEDGQIRFRASDGRVVVLAPGEQLRWPLPPELPVTPPETVPAPVATPATPGTFAPADDLLHEVEVLRSRHEYARATRLLAQAPSSWPLPTRERLSFELGTIYTHQLEDRARACTQWRLHRAHFPHGRYDADVKRAQRELGCRGPR